MNTFWCYKGYLVRSSEHLYFSLTALDVLLVFFHFKNKSTYLIYWYTCLFSPLFTLRHAFLNLLFTRILAKHAFWCSFVSIYSSMHKQVEASSVFAQSCRCARASDVCAGNFSHSARLLLQQSRASFMLASCLRAVLISRPDTWDWTRMHALVVIHRRTLYENADSAKIKVSFYTTDIDILRVASMHRIVIHCINISIHIDDSLHP